ncbi:MAG: hypothetical protein OIF32_07055, partial [Campylobacterales bacterium]|nr:hypothetical protein [Campylobacterales bacterium]
LVDGQIHIELVIEKSSKELDLEFIYEKEPPEFYENSFSDIVVDVLKNQLNLSSIDNMFFHTHYKNIFISEIKKIIEPLYNSKETLLDPFCEFLFNKYQDYILLDIGEKIMILILGKVPNIAKFINFYNGNPTSINGQTIEKPNITYLENVYTYNSILSALNNRQNFITKHNIEKLERGDFLLERMKKSLLGLIEKREELDKQKVEETSKEYQDLLFDIDITERDIINRENRKKKADEENASLKEEYQQLNDQKEDIKKALISAIKSFDKLL